MKRPPRHTYDHDAPQMTLAGVQGPAAQGRMFDVAPSGPPVVAHCVACGAPLFTTHWDRCRRCVDLGASAPSLLDEPSAAAPPADPWEKIDPKIAHRNRCSGILMAPVFGVGRRSCNVCDWSPDDRDAPEPAPEPEPEPDVRPNRYAGACRRCGGHVDADAGALVGRPGSWGVEHRGECPEPDPDAPEPGTLEGMHRTDDGTVYKVQLAVHGSGRPYAKRLVVDDDGGHFEYDPGAVRDLSTETRMTLEEAKAFGALYGFCCVCAATLTDEASIAAGIGPVCATRF